MAYTTIDDPSAYFQTALYTGNGGDDRAVTNDGNSNLQPDFLWFKTRSESGDHNLVDSVRGANKLYKSNETDAEETVSNGVQSFTSDGFTVNQRQPMNKDNVTYACWQWKTGTSFTNDASSTGIGTIDSAGSVNQDAGFSICSYTGTGSAGTIGHGLSATPKMIIAKNRSDGGQFWAVYHASLGGANKYLSLNSTSSEQGGTAIWNSTHPTSSVFSVAGHGTTNENGDGFIAYCFAEKKGYSKFGSYVGNNNADGNFIYLGFKPSFFLAKNSTESGYSWEIFDNKRNSPDGVGNIIKNRLFPDSAASEGINSGGYIDFVSNGVKIRKAGDTNSNNTYIYMAFAENPFVTSTGVPATAR